MRQQTIRRQTWLLAVVLGGSAVSLGCADDSTSGTSESTPVVAPAAVTPAAKAAPSRTLSPNTRFTVRTPDQDAVKQIASEVKARDLRDAIKLGAMAATPQASWFTSGTPQQVQSDVSKTMCQADLTRTVPVLVAYNIPFRDCAQYSAGGALDTASYEAWIDGFAAGIGKRHAVVILEPDSLGIIPWNGGSGDWCQPTVTDAAGNTTNAPGADPATRYAQLNYAVDKLAATAPNALVYLDGTHSGWLNVANASTRLANAGVARAEGFFLNISNYQITGNLAQYGTWISDCLAYGNSLTPADFSSCPDQYWNGGPLPSLIAQISGEWAGGPLDPNGAWSDSSTTVALNTSGINLRYANMLGTILPTARFVIDTSRNGHGPLNGAQYGAAPYDQPATVQASLTSGNWCNPPDAGLGLRPTANTGVALVDAYLWVKIPGESDGSCDIAGGPRAWDYTEYNPWGLTGDAQNHFDVLWGMVDPAAGLWFPQQALQLAQNAVPPLL
jgi:endoglucanase